MSVIWYVHACVCVCVFVWVENVLHLAKHFFFEAKQCGSLPLNDLLLCANPCFLTLSHTHKHRHTQTPPLLLCVSFAFSHTWAANE